MLELTGLTKTYGHTKVVDGLSLIVERGQIFGILGSNGAGKTTSVECAQGIRRPDSGKVTVLGHITVDGFEGYGDVGALMCSPDAAVHGIDSCDLGSAVLLSLSNGRHEGPYKASRLLSVGGAVHDCAAGDKPCLLVVAPLGDPQRRLVGEVRFEKKD